MRTCLCQGQGKYCLLHKTSMIQAWVPGIWVSEIARLASLSTCIYCIYIYYILTFLARPSLLVSKCDKPVHWVPLPSLLRSLAARHLKESRWRADHPIRWQRTAMFQQHMTPWESVRNISAVHLAVIAKSALGIFKFQACKDCGVTPQFASSTLAFILDIETLRLLLSSTLKFENRMFYYFLMLCFLHWLWALWPHLSLGHIYYWVASSRFTALGPYCKRSPCHTDNLERLQVWFLLRLPRSRQVTWWFHRIKIYTDV